MKDGNDMEEQLKEFIFLTFKRNYSKLKEIGLYPGQDQIIDYIANHEGVCQKDICLFTGREAPTVAKAIQRLVASGYISKVNDQKNKKRNHLYLTKLGWNAYHKMIELKKENRNDMKDILSEEELETIQKVLSKVCNKMKGETGHEENI
jgi:DNA-binding MarR family transcriptional regulator